MCISDVAGSPEEDLEDLVCLSVDPRCFYLLHLAEVLPGNLVTDVEL